MQINFYVSWDNSADKGLIHKQLEMLVCVISTLATDALVLKHQAITTHNANSLVSVMHCTGPVSYKGVYFDIVQQKLKLHLE